LSRAHRMDHCVPKFARRKSEGMRIASQRLADRMNVRKTCDLHVRAQLF
jgi:hypothetical protein